MVCRRSRWRRAESSASWGPRPRDEAAQCWQQNQTHPCLPTPPAHQLYVTSRDFHATPLCAPVKQRGRCSLSLIRCCEQVMYCRSRGYDVLVFTFYTMQMSHVQPNYPSLLCAKVLFYAVSMYIRRILPNSIVILLAPNIMCSKFVINNIKRGNKRLTAEPSLISNL